MKFTHNMGTLDRVIRVAIAATIAVPICNGTIAGVAAIILGTLAVIFVATGGTSMITAMATHQVDDVDHWLASPKRAEFFAARGSGLLPFSTMSITSSEESS